MGKAGKETTLGAKAYGSYEKGSSLLDLCPSRKKNQRAKKGIKGGSKKSIDLRKKKGGQKRTRFSIRTLKIFRN